MFYLSPIFGVDFYCSISVSIVTKIIDDIKADTSAQHKIGKENFEAVKADAKARFNAAAEPNADFTEFRDAKGLKAKADVVGEHLERNGKEMRAQSKKSYEETLKKQREHINGLTKKIT